MGAEVCPMILSQKERSLHKFENFIVHVSSPARRARTLFGDPQCTSPIQYPSPFFDQTILYELRCFRDRVGWWLAVRSFTRRLSALVATSTLKALSTHCFRCSTQRTWSFEYHFSYGSNSSRSDEGAHVSRMSSDARAYLAPSLQSSRE